MDQTIIDLRLGENGGTHEDCRITLPEVMPVSLSCRGGTLEQTFQLKKTILHVRAYFNLEVVKQKIHFMFYCGQGDSGWDSQLVLHDVVPYFGTEMWRSVGYDRRYWVVRWNRAKVWKNHPTKIGVDEVVPMMATLLNQHLQAVGWEGFNAWLARMTPQGKTIGMIPPSVIFCNVTEVRSLTRCLLTSGDSFYLTFASAQ